MYDMVFEDGYLYLKQNLKPKMDLLECNYIMQVCVQKCTKKGIYSSPSVTYIILTT